MELRSQMEADTLAALEHRLRSAWCRETSSDPENWTCANPAWGQCAVTALVVQDHFGGELVRAIIDGISHYWNRIESGSEIDLTRHQFQEGGVIETTPEIRQRSYVLSYTATAARYERLRARLRKTDGRGI